MKFTAIKASKKHNNFILESIKIIYHYDIKFLLSIFVLKDLGFLHSLRDITKLFKRHIAILMADAWGRGLLTSRIKIFFI